MNVGVLDVLTVHEEQGDGERWLIFLWHRRPVAALVGAQAGDDSSRVPGS